MARRRKTHKSTGMMILILLFFGLSIISAAFKYVGENIGIVIFLGCTVVFLFVIFRVSEASAQKRRRELLQEILVALSLDNINTELKEYDDHIILKSRQAFDNYTDLKYLKDNDIFESVKAISDRRKQINACLRSFLYENSYKQRHQYAYVSGVLANYLNIADGYRILVSYFTSAGNVKDARVLYLSSYRIDEIAAHPEYLMSKGEYNKLLKQQEKAELDAKKHNQYERVNAIIDFANQSKETLIVKHQIAELDTLVENLFDKTINSIQKVSTIDSDAWGMLDNFITSTENSIYRIIAENKRISDYYESVAFSKIKDTCSLLAQSQREFNEYIDEKAQSITKLFGVRAVRNETQNKDVYNYIRAYKKSISPFTAEVSSSVFGSAENNPLAYVIKYFYPNKSQYKVQIEKLRQLIEELETLKEAKKIIDDYKKEYDQYVQDVPKYVMDADESGFYSRLGLTIIDESELTIEYKFIYTSDGGMVQRSFTVPMSEENIAELVHQLESKLSLDALAKEQRALMTPKLRNFIKERDNYTCCECGNSVYAEPNLLLEIDHIIPVSKGGLTQTDNLRTLCWRCNRSKGAKLVS